MFIKNYEPLYLIKKDGTVLSSGKGNSNNSKLKELTPFKTGKDRKYLKVRLYKDGKYKDFSVHRLVAEHYLPNDKQLPHVNHKDENTLNNNVSNLEWCTAQYNKEFSSSINIELKAPDNKIVQIFNISKFCRDNQLSNGSIYHVLSGKYNQHKGWKLP